MALSLNGRMNGNGRRRYRPLADINVTPLVDVMLVLLVIFMITAPMMTSGINVDLPKTNATPLNSDAQPLTVSIDAQGKIYIQDTQVDLPGLVAKLQALSQNDPTRRIFVRGDKALPYGDIMQVMGTITQGGFTKVALLAEETPGQAAQGGAAPPAASGSGQNGTPPAPAPVPAKPGKG